MSLPDTSHYSMLIEWSDGDQAYVVSFPEWEQAGLIGHTHGAPYEEAVRNGQDVLAGLIALWQRLGHSWPRLHAFVNCTCL